MSAGADMDVAVGVRRAVVEDEQRRAFRALAQLLVEAHLLPALEPSGLGLGQARLHREVGRRQEQGAAVIVLGVGVFGVR